MPPKNPKVTKKEYLKYFSLLPIRLYVFAFILLAISIAIKWKLKVDITVLFYCVGAIIGLHLFDSVERYISQTSDSLISASPLRNIVVQWGLLIITFFVLTSSQSILGKGVILFLNVRLVYMQQMLAREHTLVSWFQQAKIEISHENEKLYGWLLVATLCVEFAVFSLV